MTFGPDANTTSNAVPSQPPPRRNRCGCPGRATLASVTLALREDHDLLSSLGFRRRNTAAGEYCIPFFKRPPPWASDGTGRVYPRWFNDGDRSMLRLRIESKHGLVASEKLTSDALDA